MRRLRFRFRPRTPSSEQQQSARGAAALRVVRRRVARAAGALLFLATVAAATATTAAVNALAATAPLPPPPLPASEPNAHSGPVPATRLLPGPSLLTAPNGSKFEVFPGCTSHVYGIPGHPDFAVYCEDTTTGRNVSFWHDIPLAPRTDPRDGGLTLWVTVEIPKGTNAKIETQTTWPFTPMAQSTIDPTPFPAGSANRTVHTLRYYLAGPSLVNYGGIPQTWEASDKPDEVTGLPSDNDPLDFLEIGSAPLPVGAVVRVRLLGALALVDSGETDWKLLVVSTRDEGAAGWRDIADVPPELRRRLYEFFRTYKVAEGKRLNTFFLISNNSTTSDSADWQTAFVGRDVAAAVLRSKYDQWVRLMAGGCTSARCGPIMAAARASGVNLVAGTALVDGGTVGVPALPGVVNGRGPGSAGRRLGDGKTGDARSK